MLDVMPLPVPDAHLKGECLTGKRATVLRAGAVAMVLRYFFNMLYLN